MRYSQLTLFTLAVSTASALPLLGNGGLLSGVLGTQAGSSGDASDGDNLQGNSIDRDTEANQANDGGDGLLGGLIQANAGIPIDLSSNRGDNNADNDADNDSFDDSSRDRDFVERFWKRNAYRGTSTNANAYENTSTNSQGSYGNDSPPAGNSNTDTGYSSNVNSNNNYNTHEYTNSNNGRPEIIVVHRGQDTRDTRDNNNRQRNSVNRDTEANQVNHGDGLLGGLIQANVGVPIDASRNRNSNGARNGGGPLGSGSKLLGF